MSRTTPPVTAEPPERSRAAGPSAAPAVKVPYPGIGSVFGSRECEAVRETVLFGRTLSAGERRAEFESRFAEHLGRRHAFSVTSGTVALEFALHLLDLRPGDEVIATPQTYLATVQPLLGKDVTVRFADVLPESLNIDPRRVEELVNDRTRAIVLVHYGGHPADMAALRRIAERHGLLIVEDCAHALGTTDAGRPAGARGDLACFSFHSSKNISTLGEGGMVAFDRDAWAERLSRIRANEPDADHVPAPHAFGDSAGPAAGALYPGLAYTHDCVTLRHPGTNATLSEPAAAVGTVQLERLPELVGRRRSIAARLTEVLDGVEGIRVPRVPDGAEHSYHLFTFFVEPGGPVSRQELLDQLAADGVQTYLRYFPLHLLPEWRLRGHRYGECPTAERLWFEQHMNLPCHPSLSDGQVDCLAASLERALHGRPAMRGSPVLRGSPAPSSTPALHGTGAG
ncbi:DegT/DnrJ/EryC1/StrS family aminotransferase [Streptomyces bathyalis]|uniref:DegT/DnrJ/EryC1/StrS family aminotransferase n=1 Tax=Streptomyces bathyalis TaxID=2710756 RepID=A0A7T1T8M5_9ACTN|nr:DegT/DnrJ/EryC1/StrS family aminotransferase [Streptomyces bathyalis]QPP08388.1 DegT/DnrJ/EryC1/StrS family aminotransferase [Streptomyces bathyalis]